MQDLHSKWSHRWLTPKAEPRKSPLHGSGVFAREKILKGESINVFGGIAVPVWEIEEYRELNGHAGVQVSDEFFIVPSDRQELEQKGIFNHSCKPNVGFNSSVTMVAICDIEPNEELVMNYAFMETHFEPFDCNCGSKNCKKVINSNSWKDREFQSKYGQYYSPYLKDKLLSHMQNFEELVRRPKFEIEGTRDRFMDYIGNALNGVLGSYDTLVEEGLPEERRERVLESLKILWPVFFERIKVFKDSGFKPVGEIKEENLEKLLAYKDRGPLEEGVIKEIDKLYNYIIEKSN